MQTAGARQSHDILYFIFYAVQKRRSLLNMQHFTPNHACYLILSNTNLCCDMC